MNLDGQHLPNMVTEVLPDLPITSSLAPSNAIGGHHGNSETTNHHPQTTLGAPDGLHIEIPTHVKALFFNNQSNNSNNSSHDMGKTKYFVSSKNTLKKLLFRLYNMFLRI